LSSNPPISTKRTITSNLKTELTEYSTYKDQIYDVGNPATGLGQA